MKVQRTGELFAWEALVGDATAGSASVHAGSGPGARFVRLSVQPRYRGRGIGRELLRTVCTALRSSGCVTVEAIAVAGSDGEAFARRAGATVGDELADDVLRFAALDRALLGALSVPRPGYDVRHWAGTAPDDLVESYGWAKRWIADAPNNFSPAVPDWTAALVREEEETRAAHGAALWVEAAILTGTGAVAAFTEIEVAGTGAEAGTGGEASQVDTVVLPGHRRYGLATMVKAALLLRLRGARPDLESVGVTCAVANAGMRAVNYRLGFREERRRILYRLAL